MSSYRAYSKAFATVVFLLFGTIAGLGSLQITPVDIHERLYPDRLSYAPAVSVINVPRGAPATFQFVVTSDRSGEAAVSVTKISSGKFQKKFSGVTKVHVLLPVHVEGNTQGSKTNRPGGKVPEGWMQHLVRAAPFDTLEVLAESNELHLQPGKTQGLMLEVSVPTNALPREYSGRVVVKLGTETAHAEFRVRVHETALPDIQSLHAVHWLWPEPHNLTRENIPAWWSERHWQLLENSGRQLRRFGDDMLYTPLVNYKEPLIQIIERADGAFDFDYDRFDRWIETFRKLGYRYFAGHHVLNLPSVYSGGVYVVDAKTGEKRNLLTNPANRDEWLKFLPTFYGSLHLHLKKKGWTETFLLHQYDEPNDTKLYQRLAALSREHLPGIRTLDAINSNQQNAYSPIVDVQVFNLPGITRFQSVVKQRADRNQNSWLYHCTSPYPPNPNRHIDCFLTESRLYPWLCFKLGAEGYLFWGANIFRGADEYKTSIGPFPNGSQNPGHPPGDNWMFYRGPDGLRPSLRMISFREGIIDHALLSLLAKQKPELAEQFTKRIATSNTTFERDPNSYHRVRAELLAALVPGK